MSRFVHKTHVLHPLPPGCGVAVNIKKEFFLGTLHETHVWQYHPMKQGMGLRDQFIKKHS